MNKFGSRFWWFSSATTQEEKISSSLAQQDFTSELPNLTTNDVTKIEPQFVPSQNLFKTETEQQLEDWLSNILKAGVLLASTVVLLGGILYLIRHGNEPADYRIFRGEPSDLCFPTGIVKAAWRGSSRGIIQFGLLLLIATPIARVAISLSAFLRMRDFNYVAIALSVLISLIYSFLKAYY
ncbi:protein of unknown function DUF1634 [Stanieria cyanosphaera PCC 7437]|uniref:DUF1634 domain-containing protein n=1 Tax=Stanieria cyanosphaera (strain ATCC 29371 / PCC 7437) TaxID=111780 RepID=K9XQQ1_STAC7|nr:DUF1634 domain-containing protein [Stanieria cyanosphaera]AFZ34386.1 protein of unknown function DUF1634 [Stanieria cyanosphaera PCC 7437]